MSDEATDDDGVIITPPDLRLQKKLGSGKSLGSILTPAITEKAETVITHFAPEIINEIFVEMKQLESLSAQLQAGNTPVDDLKTIIEIGFSIKSKAGMCDYALASSLARYMHLFCEATLNKSLTTKDVKTIQCFVGILKIIFERKLVGSGGDKGNVIIQEAEKLIALHAAHLAS